MDQLLSECRWLGRDAGLLSRDGAPTHAAGESEFFQPALRSGAEPPLTACACPNKVVEEMRIAAPVGQLCTHPMKGNPSQRSHLIGNATGTWAPAPLSACVAAWTFSLRSRICANSLPARRSGSPRACPPEIRSQRPGAAQ